MTSRGRRSDQRRRGNIETLRSGAKRIRVYNGLDPVTKKPIYVGETVAANTPGLDKAAERALIRWLKTVDDQKAPRTNATVDELINAFLDVIDIDRGTLRGWRNKQKNHIRPLLGETSLKKAHPHVLETFFAELRRCRKHCGRQPQVDHRTPRQHERDHRCVRHQCEGLSTSSVREIHTILNGAFGRAVVWEWLGANPLDQVPPPEAPKPNPQPPKTHEAAQLINKAWRNDPAWGACVWLAFTTGKRRGDLCGLRISAVDLESGVAEFGLVIKQDGRDIYTGDPKGKRHTRVVLDPETVEVLREHLARCAALAAAAGATLDPETSERRRSWLPACPSVPDH
ncbi:site-specific integrase [Actinophytocola algeriensis]|uniref:Site-specific recombinase XerC n=1 Tax=Actinophytocola algeriensis TaxID=1768010 RepID=A0A7W7VC23_9PSEU|nr:site-specific integrase [Actinophytocola algeriensis]MBB4904572.1 site-specific recombinase XerC [Actinophytocola algeriensis]MBE1476569.1 integrase [Actinophytocola algeriensis]